MNAKKLEEIKKQAIATEMRGRCSGELWDARRLLEEAAKDGLKLFRDKVRQARARIDEAEQFYLQSIE